MKVMVSVIIPVHNGADTIAKAIDSVLIQEVPLEIIIIDDGSTDHLAEALSPYLDRSAFTVLHNEHNVGVAESRNRGVRKASGEYVAFLDCDDWWEPGKLKAQLALLQKTGYVLCATGRRLILPDGTPTKRVIGVKERLTYRDLLFQNQISCSSVVLKRSAAATFPMVHDDCHEDYIMWLQLLKHYRYACAVNRPFLNYRQSTTGKSGNKFQSAYMTFKVYRYMGFSVPKSCICFLGYMINGIKKYYFHQ